MWVGTPSTQVRQKASDGDHSTSRKACALSIQHTLVGPDYPTSPDRSRLTMLRLVMLLPIASAFLAGESTRRLASSRDLGMVDDDTAAPAPPP